jgi:hypothetical protein
MIKTMLNKLIPSTFLLMMFFTLSCHHDTNIKNSEKKSDRARVMSIDTVTDDLSSFISGMAYNSKNQCLSKLDSMTNWRKYSGGLDKIFIHDDSLRLGKMKNWANREFQKNKSTTTLFYPFSGPDFLNANILYPNADQYIMIGLEPVGSLPEICNMPPDSVNDYLNEIDDSMKDIFRRSYFITSTMKNEMKTTKVNGTIPLIVLFIRRTGHHIISAQRIGVNSEGKLQIIDSMRNKENIVPGIKIDFVSLPEERIQSVYYFSTDISDKGLEKNHGFVDFLSQLPPSNTFIKAASFLMHYNGFKKIRSLIFDISSTILQDDSGIAFRYFDKSKWDIKLYGKYSKPKNEFSNISEPDLEKAYKHTLFRPLPFNLGYNWGTDHTSLLYAVKK